MNDSLFLKGERWKPASSSKAICEMSINNWGLLCRVLHGWRDPHSQSPPVGQRNEARWTGLMVFSAQTAASNTITAVTLLSSRTRSIPGWQQLCTHWSASEWLTSRVKAVQLSSPAIISNLHKHMLLHSAYPHTHFNSNTSCPATRAIFAPLPLWVDSTSLSWLVICTMSGFVLETGLL